MKKRIKQSGKYVFLTIGVLGTAMLAGCSQEVSALFGSDGTTQVEVTARVADATDAMTRAADGLNSSSGFTLLTSASSTSKVRVMVDQNNGSYNSYDYDITGATTLSRTTKPTFNSGVNSVNVYGWYPAKNLTSFTVEADQTGNSGYCLSDLMTAVGTTCTRNEATGAVTNSANLSFTHVMAKVKVNLTLASGVTVTSVKFKSMMKTVTLTETKSGNVVTGYSVGNASSAGDITLFSGGSLTSSSSAADRLLCGVFPKQNKSGAFLEITASYNGGIAQTITYSFGNSSSKTFETGKVYLMNISLQGTDITTGTVSIANWGTADGTVNIGLGALSLDKSSLAMTYGDAAQTLQISGSVTIKSDGSTAFNVTSSNTAVATVSTSGTTVTVTPTGVGSTTVTVTDANKNTNTATCAVTVEKGTPSVTAPSYVSSTLTYNKSAQTLITAGSSSSGTTMQYALGNSSTATGTWATTLPTGTNAGTYYVWYKVLGGSNYNDVDAKMISGGKTIAKATPSVTAPTAKSNLLYNGSAQQLINAGSTTGGTLQYSLNNSSWSNDPTTITGTEAQEYTVYYKVVGNDNYNNVAANTIKASIITSPLAAVTSADIGKVVCAAGHLHDAKTPVPTGCTAVGILGKVTENGHGLIVAMQNATDQTWNTINGWTSITSYASTTLKLLPNDDARGSLTSYTDLGGYPVSNWCVGQKTDYEPIMKNLGSAKSDSDGYTYDSKVNDYFTSSGGSAFGGGYWSATEYGSNGGWNFYANYWGNGGKTSSYHVRPLLAF